GQCHAGAPTQDFPPFTLGEDGLDNGFRRTLRAKIEAAFDTGEHGASLGLQGDGQGHVVEVKLLPHLALANLRQFHTRLFEQFWSEPNQIVSGIAESDPGLAEGFERRTSRPELSPASEGSLSGVDLRQHLLDHTGGFIQVRRKKASGHGCRSRSVTTRSRNYNRTPL